MAAVFYKTINGFRVSVAGEVTLDTPFTITRPVNSTDPAEVKGFELAYQQPLDKLVHGLGIISSYTYVDSSVEALNGAGTITTTFPSLSRYSYNLTGYYENDKFSGRLSYNWLDDFVETTFIRGRSGLLISCKAANFLDASASYNINDNCDFDDCYQRERAIKGGLFGLFL